MGMKIIQVKYPNELVCNSYEREIMELQKELDRVVSKQAFEKAVEIRDRIHFLEEELKQSGEHND